MPNPGHNEGFRVLEEFTSEAISSHEESPYKGRGMDAGMRVLEEDVHRSPAPPVPLERLAELRRLSSPDLLALIQSSGPELDNLELLAIHEIAVERLGRGQGSSFEESLELSRGAMLAAVGHRS